MTIEYNVFTKGLGTAIAQLSTLVDTKNSFRLNLLVDYDNNTNIIELKKILNIDDDKIKIIPTALENKKTDVETLNLGDWSKFFSPYIQSEKITVFGKSFTTSKKNKPCIGLFIHRNSLRGYRDRTLTVFPDNRHHSLDVNHQIVKLIMESGYDVITINDFDISLEHKVSMMNELCDAVISYEGGLSHLAHVLQIPTIMLPWRFGYNGESLTFNEKLLGTYSVHLDRKTWFLESVDELLGWTSEQLRWKIQELQNNLGNNVYFTEHNLPNMLPQIFCEFEKDFFKKYLTHRIEGVVNF